MAQKQYTVLLADPDARLRALLAEQLTSIGCAVLHAGDGNSALALVNERPVRLVVTELYMKAGTEDDLIRAIRLSPTLRNTRTLALTSCATSVDRDWAMRAGADAYLIKPTRAERLRYVVGRLSTTRGANSVMPEPGPGSIARKDSLSDALGELERGLLGGTSAIVFARKWWDQLTRTEQIDYRKRAKRVGVTLRSDSMLGEHFVEVRGSPSERGLTTERAVSPYRS